MRWRKLGRITTEHAAYPATDRVGGRIRLYFARRIDQGPSRVHFLEVDPEEPTRPGLVHDRPLFDLGPPGTFDADGHAARWVVDSGGGEKLMYLIGWNRSRAVPYHLAIGVARSVDGGRTWVKRDGPVMDRSIDEPFLCTSPSVLFDPEAGIYRMWYCGGLGWHEHQGRLEPLYRIHHAESPDGLRWRRTPHVCVDAFPGGDAIGYPAVWREDPGYRMLFCYRGRAGYRDDRASGYRLGLATSIDGLSWDLRNEEVGIDRDPEGWESVMMAYPSMVDDLLFYNGNGFGATGIGVARRTDIADKEATEGPSTPLSNPGVSPGPGKEARP